MTLAPSPCPCCTAPSLPPPSLGLLAPQAAHAQLSLGDALREADRGAYANRAASGAAAASRAGTLLPLRGILPSARIEAGFVRTTDPIGAFGTTLRQRAVTQAAFDPARLNFPAPVDNYQAGAVAELPLFNPDAWTGRRAARHAADAADAQADWTRIETHTDVVRAYFGAVLADERAATLRAAVTAAQAHLRQAPLDGARRAGHQGRRAPRRRPRRRSGSRPGRSHRQRHHRPSRSSRLLLGRPVNDLPVVPAALPPAQQIRAIAAADTGAQPQASRADVTAAEAGSAAARADALRARSTLLPRLNSFARYDWNAPGGLFAGQKNWTVGVMASWSLFCRRQRDRRHPGRRRQAARRRRPG